MVGNVDAGAGLIPASKANRLVAYILDEVILFAGFLFLLSPLTFFLFSGNELGGVVSVLLFLVAFGLLAIGGRTAYYSWFHASRGHTPGKKALGLRLVSPHTGERPSARACLLRQFVLMAPMAVGLVVVAVAGGGADVGSFQTLGLAANAVFFGSVLLHPGGRGIHDRVAGTMVVRAVGCGAAAAPDQPGAVNGW